MINQSRQRPLNSVTLLVAVVVSLLLLIPTSNAYAFKKYSPSYRIKRSFDNCIQAAKNDTGRKKKCYLLMKKQKWALGKFRSCVKKSKGRKRATRKCLRRYHVRKARYTFKPIATTPRPSEQANGENAITMKGANGIELVGEGNAALPEGERPPEEGAVRESGPIVTKGAVDITLIGEGNAALPEGERPPEEGAVREAGPIVTKGAVDITLIGEGNAALPEGERPPED